jgi:polyhydroxyalkanoate synthase subunit PhaE
MSEDPFQKFYKAWLDTTKGYMAPWLAGTQTGDQEQSKSAPHFGVDWATQSKEFFERILWFPPFSVVQGTAGPAIQNYAKYAEISSLSIEIYKRWIDLYLEFSRAMAEVTTKLNTRFLTSDSSVDPKQAYAIWLEELTQGLDKLLRNDEVAVKMAGFLSNIVDLKKETDGFMEGYFKSMNIPTRSEMDRAYKEIYDLKKTLRSMKKNSESP